MIESNLPLGAIRLRGVNVAFGAGLSAVRAVENINLDIVSGEFLSVLAPVESKRNCRSSSTVREWKRR